MKTPLSVNSNTGQNGKHNNSNYRYCYFNNAVNLRKAKLYLIRPTKDEII